MCHLCTKSWSPTTGSAGIWYLVAKRMCLFICNSFIYTESSEFAEMYPLYCPLGWGNLSLIARHTQAGTGTLLSAPIGLCCHITKFL